MKMVANFLKVALIAFILAAVDPNFILIPFKIVWALTLGWAFVAARLASRLQEHASALVIWGLLFLTLGFAAHRFFRHVAESRKGSWQIRWTIAGLGGVWLSLFAAMAMIGVVHQIGWIAVSRERWLRGNEKIRLSLAANLVSNAAKDGEWTDDRIRRAVPFDWVDLIIQHDTSDNKITNVVVIHRDGRTGFVEIRPDGRLPRRPMDELKEALHLTVRK